MATRKEIWRPGSFTKNFSWGNPSVGLVELHEVIRLGFDNQMRDVPRAEFRERVKATGRPDYIPINFFLFNRTVNGTDFLCADELVFQALNWAHSPRFDKLALFTFNFSFAGHWKGASEDQRRPALWANAYIRERVADELNWDTSQVNANDIQRFVESSPHYKAETSRKLATNLSHMFDGGGLKDFPTPRIERWWIDCLFLALDRIIENRLLEGKETKKSEYHGLLTEFYFLKLTGNETLEKDLAINHLIDLYAECGGRQRFSDDLVRELILKKPGLIQPVSPNDPRPRGAVHQTNPRILKSIPALCAMLARYAGFDDLSPDDMENFDIEHFLRSKTQAALAHLKAHNIRPIMTAEEIMKLTREK